MNRRSNKEKVIPAISDTPKLPMWNEYREKQQNKASPQDYSLLGVHDPLGGFPFLLCQLLALVCSVSLVHFTFRKSRYL